MALAPDLRTLDGASGAVFGVVALWLDQVGEQAKISRGRRIDRTNTKSETGIAYLERAVNLFLPKPLLWARGTPPLPDDWLGGATLGLACTLGAICPRVFVLAVDVLPPAGVEDADVHSPATTGAGVLLPTSSMGDLLSNLGVGTFPIVISAEPFSPAADAEASTPARCWTSGGLLAFPASKSSVPEKFTPPDEDLCSGVDSGMVCGERPSFSRLLFSFSCSSFLFLLVLRVSSSSFCLFSASALRRFAAWVSGSGGSEMYPLRVSPCERD